MTKNNRQTMKKSAIAIIVSALTVLASCGGKAEKEAAVMLDKAKEAYEDGSFNLAKNRIDSMKTMYPKAFKAREEGLKLMRLVEIGEQEKTIAFLDSIADINDKAIAEILPDYKFSKDTAYEDIGTYSIKSQSIENNMYNSYIYARVDENGVMKLTSAYAGKRPIEHYAVRITAPDGSFAETPQSTDTFRDENAGTVTERTDYTVGADNDVAAFIDLNKDKNLKAEYIGKGNTVYYMSRRDKQAVSDIYRLHKLLDLRTQINRQRKEASNKIEFFRRKAEESMRNEGNAGQ